MFLELKKFTLGAEDLDEIHRSSTDLEISRCEFETTQNCVFRHARINSLYPTAKLAESKNFYFYIGKKFYESSLHLDAATRLSNTYTVRCTSGCDR